MDLQVPWTRAGAETIFTSMKLPGHRTELPGDQRRDIVDGVEYLLKADGCFCGSADRGAGKRFVRRLEKRLLKKFVPNSRVKSCDNTFVASWMLLFRVLQMCYGDIRDKYPAMGDPLLFPYFFSLRALRILRSSRSFGLPAACFISMRSSKEA
jgi:hypothetical protein